MRIREKGTHTCEIFIRYHRCPQCGLIIESREDYTPVMGKYMKELSCSRCEKRFTETRSHRPATEFFD